MKNFKSHIEEGIVQIFFVAFAFSILFTFYYLVSSSLKTNFEWAQNQFGLPHKPTIENFTTVWREGIGTAFMNTLFLSIATVGVTLLFASLAAYSIVIMRFRWNHLMFFIFIAMMYISPMSLIIPLFIQMVSLNLVDNLYSMVVIYSGLYISFAIFLLTTYFKAVPINIIDAAKIDGCGDLRMLFQVVIPISKAGVLILSLLVFFQVWSDLLFALIFLRSENHWTLMVAIGQYEGRYIVNTSQIMATLFISMIPLIVIYLFTQKYFTRGTISGSFR